MQYVGVDAVQLSSFSRYIQHSQCKYFDAEEEKMSRSVYSVVKYYCFRRGLHDYERLTKFMRFGGMHTMAFPNTLEAFVLGLCVVLYLSNSSSFFDSL